MSSVEHNTLLGKGGGSGLGLEEGRRIELTLPCWSFLPWPVFQAVSGNQERKRRTGWKDGVVLDGCEGEERKEECELNVSSFNI